jgi:hypothetical protein
MAMKSKLLSQKKRDLASEEGISTENGQKVTVKILNLNTGESYTGRLSITGNQQIYVPTEIQQMIKSGIVDIFRPGVVQD